jgi:hypothetical protein
MASFTPSNLMVQSMGSMRLTLARINVNILSGTNYWASGITDIKSILVQPWGGTPIVTSSSGFQIVWTATTGTIHLITDGSSSGSGYLLWVASGGPS